MTDKKASIRAALRKHAAMNTDGKGGLKLSDALHFVPFIGGGMHGMVNPAKGANRFESVAAQGSMGAMGGLAGAATAGAGGAYLTEGMENEEMRRKIIAVMAVLGAGAGTAMGSGLGRYMVKREPMTPEELEALADVRRRGLGKTAQEPQAAKGATMGKVRVPQKVHRQVGLTAAEKAKLAKQYPHVFAGKLGQIGYTNPTQQKRIDTIMAGKDDVDPNKTVTAGSR